LDCTGMAWFSTLQKCTMAMRSSWWLYRWLSSNDGTYMEASR
jgi:hypothetical protein